MKRIHFDKPKPRRQVTMGIYLRVTILSCNALFFLNCASQIRQTPVGQITQAAPPAAELQKPGLKHRIAIASFEDKTGYGNNLFGATDDLGTQSSDILASHLIKTGDFVVLEREKLGNLKSENDLQGKESNIAGCTALIFGSVTEFGTKTEHQDAGLSKSKVQTAHAKVTIRMVDPSTGQAFFSEFGEADAKNETNQVLGFGGSAGYDATLTDKALNAAITKLVGNILNNLRSRQWKAPVLDIEAGQVFIGAGSRTGVKVGQALLVMKPGKKIKNPATGVMMELPGSQIGKIQVVSLFGDSDLNEGAICSVQQGQGITKDCYVISEVQ
jgi:curli biogenesis system outer membrane secretion channel CsgG